MNAVISGRAGIAILVEGPRLFSIDVLHPERVPRHPAEVPHLLGEARDLLFLEDIALEEARKRLLEASDAEDALRMTLRLLDGELPQEVRRDAADDLEALLASPAVEEQVERVLLAHPFPGGADPAGAVEAARRASSKQALAFVQRLIAMQPAVREVLEAWNEIPIDLLPSAAERMRAQRVMVRAGVFRGLVKARAAGSRADAVVALGLQRGEIKALPGHRALFQAWTARLPSTSGSVRAQGWETELRDAEPSSERSKPPRVAGLNRTEIFENVKRRKAEILRAIDGGDLARVWTLVDQLVAYHLGHGGAEFAVKSLCDLAKEAQRRGDIDAQVELTGRAVALGPHDGYAWTQRGNALLNARLLPEALDACDLGLAYQNNAVAKCSRADVLKALGRLDDALTAYEQVEREHPDDVVARNGKADVLAALGRSSEALALLPDTPPRTEQDWIGAHLRGMILLRTGQVEQAITIFEHGAAGDPNPTSRDYYRTALAVARLRLRQYAAAASVLTQIASPLVQTRTALLRVHSFGAQGQTARAAEAFKQVPPRPPPIIVDLIEELRLRYVEGRPAQHDDDWVLQHEIDYALDLG